ncbi:MAG: XRE family transcriptional regulator, partial [Pseudonocardiaceae bacterium]
GQFRMEAALEVGDHERAVMIAEGLSPPQYSNQSGRAHHWLDYGQALARLRGRHADAVLALRRAELISPHRIQRNPIIRDVLAVLLRHSRRGSTADQELRGMARRAGLPV